MTDPFADMAAKLNLSPAEFRTLVDAAFQKLADEMGPFRGAFDDGQADSRLQQAAQDHMFVFEHSRPSPDQMAQYVAWSLGGRIRPGSRRWPSDKPFPLTPEQCLAAMQGYAVDLGPDAMRAFEDMPDRWELMDGFLVARG